MVKITDVARHAGVSISTVSYVLSGKRAISEQTRQRVEHSIRELGYRPHAGARALASSRSNVIALVVPLRTGVDVPVVMQFVTSVVTTARTHDHDVLLLTQDEGVQGLERVSGSALVDAIIVMDVELHDARVPVLRTLDHPAVLIGIPSDTDGLTCIDLDFEAAGARCVEHLAERGHRRVGLLGPPPQVYARETGFAQRMAAGFGSAAERLGVAPMLRSCEPDAASVRQTVTGLLAEHPDLTGLVVHNEPAVAPLLDALRAAGRAVPGDLSVVAVCPDELAERSTPPLTSIAVPAHDVGQRAVDLLMNKLDEHEVPAVTRLAPRLTDRSSTAGRRTAP